MTPEGQVDLLRARVPMGGRLLRVVLPESGEGSTLVAATLRDGGPAGPVPGVRHEVLAAPDVRVGADGAADAARAALRSAVLDRGADVGLLLVDEPPHLVVIDDRGDRVDQGAVLALVALGEVAAERTAGRSAVVVVDAIVPRVVPDLARASGATVVGSATGSAAVRAAMTAHDAVGGATGDGEYLARDLAGPGSGALAALHVLAALGAQAHQLSVLAELFRPYAASGPVDVPADEAPAGDLAAARERVVAAYVVERGAGPVEVDDGDVLVVSHWALTPQWWFTLRAATQSATGSPTLRVEVEAADEDIMAKVRDDVLALVRDDGKRTS